MSTSEISAFQKLFLRWFDLLLLLLLSSLSSSIQEFKSQCCTTLLRFIIKLQLIRLNFREIVEISAFQKFFLRWFDLLLLLLSSLSSSIQEFKSQCYTTLLQFIIKLQLIRLNFRKVIVDQRNFYVFQKFFLRWFDLLLLLLLLSSLSSSIQEFKVLCIIEL